MENSKISENRDPKFIMVLGWIGTTLSMAMYISYIPQIAGNLHGAKGDWLQPLVAGFNCMFWVGYGLLKKKKEWPIVIANVPGIIFGFFASITALFF